MKFLITGSRGFVGKNLVADLKATTEHEVYEYHRQTPLEKLEEWTKEADFVFHLAGVNRPQTEDEFTKGNVDFTAQLLELLTKYQNKAPIVVTSSIQAELENPYGISKKAGEDLVFNYAKKQEVEVLVYRLPNLFGKWSKPNYNSVVATFCHNIARGNKIVIYNPENPIELCYIDDLIDEFKLALNGKANRKGAYAYVPTSYSTTVGEIADLIYSFKETRQNLLIPNQTGLSRKLYATYLSFLPADEFAYDLTMHQDPRGSFTEFLKTPENGQVSINVAKAGITKGQHWHHSKNEKFLVVAGEGVIRFRKIGEAEILEYSVSEKKLEVVDIPVGYTHSIINTGEKDMITIMWASELFDPDNTDTYFEEV